MTDIVEAARESLKHPEHFAYYGDLHEEDGWGRCFGVHRDSDVLDRSNWDVITEDLMGRFPDDFHIEEASHFLVGWVQTLRVRVLSDPAELWIREQNITDAFRAAMEWKDRLEEYPIADEEEYCRVEYEEFWQYISDEVPYIWNREHDDDMPEHLPSAVAQILSQQHSRADDVPYKEMEAAVYDAWIAGLIEDATQFNPDQLTLDN